MLLDTGLRLQELSSLAVEDLDMARQVIRVRQGKQQKERLVSFGRSAYSALSKYLDLRQGSSPALWVTQNSKALQANGIRLMFERLRKRAGISDVRVSAHTFRHTFAINYLKNGGDVFTLQRILGHATLEMTRRYTNAMDQEYAIERQRLFSPADKWGL